jgi:membrane-associated protease RseP (regulator of RpoE activity)
MSFLLGVLIFVVALLISVMLHELGHFLTAKKFHMKVTQFFVGFGQTLWSRRRGETEYGIKAIPLGGFVKITGMTALEDIDPADEPRSFRRQPAWQRLIVMFAGSFMHFALAFVLLVALAAGIGLADANTTAIGVVDSCVPASVTALDHASCAHSLGVSPAKRAGLRAGDVVVSIAGIPVHSWVQLGAAIRKQPVGKPMTVVVDRNGRQVKLTAIPAAVPHRSGAYLGVENTVAFNRADPLSALAFAGSTFGEVVTSSAQAAEKLPAALPDLFAKNRSHTAAGSVTSVVGAADIAGQAVAASTNWRYTVASLLLIVISLNIFVGLFNLLPLLPLDGGHIAVIIFEQVRSWLARLRGKPDPGLVDMQKLVPVSVGVFALLVGLSLLLVAADIFNPIHLTQ